MDQDDQLPTRRPRSDGVQARERILGAALRLFVERGYASTSVRDIAQAADANVAAIAYYFGDKAGLYRAALYEPICARDGEDALSDVSAAPLPLRTALARTLRACLAPLGQGRNALLCVRLRQREAFEPTGMLDDERPQRDRLQRHLTAILARELGVDPDSELIALAFSIKALVVYPYIGHEHIHTAEPRLFDAPGALDAWVERLTAYAAAMVDAERARRFR
ncbi:CerR family C-terminal domain-containing protein [Massilia sp. YIM B02763]|uniref:TetR/AcrR family transcriptional regulator n=1 Tax=Massilia sp. YIM B02763 TaxID=3050130 RepID=UPI0025B69F42|nr:CerR family C-terminal domain-containing protein [Massilia sp. YIM B02763]MDN4051581.1 CerR family C-terminal domain-containing protein [Massilia sp. YIM B02763]